jgi:putative tricarboxylic transport membrane protein
MSGVYAIEQSAFDLVIVLAAGVLGYVMRQLRFPVLPLVLGVVLGFMVESNYRRSLVISRGDHMIFLEDKVSLALLSLTVVLLVYSVVAEMRSARGAKGEAE